MPTVVNKAQVIRLNDAIKWHRQVAELHRAPPDEKKAAELQAEADRYSNAAESARKAWEASRGRDYRHKDAAAAAEDNVRKFSYLATLAASQADLKQYVTHSLVAAQLEALQNGADINEAVYREVSGMLQDEEVAKEVKDHPSFGIYASREGSMQG